MGLSQMVETDLRELCRDKNLNESPLGADELLYFLFLLLFFLFEATTDDRHRVAKDPVNQPDE